MELAAKVVLLTGAKRIGADVAAAVAARGADVAILYRSSPAEAEDVAAAVRAAGQRALVIQGDVSDPLSCGAAVSKVDTELGRLDVLVNMASLYRRVLLEELTPDRWRQQLAVDLDGTFHCSLAAVPIMRRLGAGRIVNFADWLVASGRPRYHGFLPYYVAKAGVQAFTEALAYEVAAHQILVNAIAPGPILPPPDTSDEEREAVAAATPLGRWGGSGEIVKAVLALIETDFITGETIRVDGGRHLH